MRKKVLLNLLLFSSLCLYSCKVDNPSDSSNDESTPSISESVSSSIDTETIYTINGTVTDVFNEKIENAAVYDGVNLLTSLDESNDFSFTCSQKDLMDKISIKADNYLTKEILLSNVNINNNTINLGDIKLVKDYKEVSSLQNNEFSLSTSRDVENLLVKISSDNKSFLSNDNNSEIDLFISTNEVSTSRDINVYKINILKSGKISTHNFGNKNISTYKIKNEFKDHGSGMSINLSIPYEMIDANNNDVIGLSMSLYSSINETTSRLLSLDKQSVIDTFNPSTYLRVDKDNNPFNNAKNDIYFLSEQEKQELTNGYALRFSVPELNNQKQDADDFYLKATKEDDGFLISMIGFGDFKDSEYVKLIFHTSTINGTGWAIQKSDASFLVSKSKTAYLTSSTAFWGFVNYPLSYKTSKIEPIYENHHNYFTLTQKVLFEEIPEYSINKKVSLFAMQFNDGTIYDAIDYRNGMLINNMSHGDPADQSSYYVIQKNEDGNSQTDEMDGFNIEFAINDDHIYAKIDRKDNYLLLTMRSYSTFDDSDYIRFIVHHKENDCTDWGLLKDDVSFSIYKDVAYYQKDALYFNENNSNQFHNYQESIHKPTYIVNQSYFEISLRIEYIEISYDITKDSILKGCLVEYINNKESFATRVDDIPITSYENQENWFNF